MNAYKVDAAKKTITIDDNVKATAAEEKDIDRYVAAGYIIKHKSQKRAKQAKDRAAKDKMKDADIQKALTDMGEAGKAILDEYLAKKKDKDQGFFAAKKYYKEEMEKLKKAEKK